MGRPKGSKNKPKDAVATAAAPSFVETTIEEAPAKVAAPKGSFLDVSDDRILEIARAIIAASSPTKGLHSEALPKGTQVYCRIPHSYDEDKPLTRDQIIELKGYPNDEKLVRMKYLVKCEKGVHGSFQCGKCGAKFISMSGLNFHGERTHDNVVLTPVEEDKRAAQDDRYIEKEARPLIEKSVASMS